jgi:hypothetical protein
VWRERAKCGIEHCKEDLPRFGNRRDGQDDRAMPNPGSKGSEAPERQIARFGGPAGSKVLQIASKHLCRLLF